MMQYSSNQLLILILCLLVIIDDIDAIRLRIPTLRLTSTFSKTHDRSKKKNHLINNEMKISEDDTIPFEVHPSRKDGEL
jgi:hypothetical protein